MDRSLGPTVYLIIVLASWILSALPIYTMAQKKGDPNAWMGFVPILQLFTLLGVAGLEWWYFLLLFVPCVNIFIVVYIWMKAAEAMDKPSWLGLLMLVPCVNFLLPFYIAYG